jgi:hypothetical protein
MSEQHDRMKRRTFLANLLFAGGITLAGLQRAQADEHPTDGWTLPDLNTKQPRPTPTPPPEPPLPPKPPNPPQPPTAGVPLPPGIALPPQPDPPPPSKPG